MNVLSLFDGMSCGQIALDQLGIPVDKYFAAEIDKFAIKVAKANYPDMIHLGDVREVRTKHGGLHAMDENGVGDLYDIDLLIGGSPCQGFSFAGQQLNFEDPRSQLFFEYVRLLKALKPKYFLLENVKMAKKSQDVISEYLGVEPIEINSNLVSAQNRRRLYWTNIPVDGLPEDRGIVLADILEDGYTDRDKSYCLDASYYKGGGASNVRLYFEKSRRQIVFGSGMNVIGKANIKGRDSIRRVYGADGKAPTLLATTGGNTQPKVGLKVVGTIEGKGFESERRVYGTDGQSPTLTGQRSTNVPKINEGTTWRKLTPVECERLQTVPDGYTAHVSNTQRYKMLGNGWTVEVIKHIMKGMM